MVPAMSASTHPYQSPHLISMATPEQQGSHQSLVAHHLLHLPLTIVVLVISSPRANQAFHSLPSAILGPSLLEITKSQVVSSTPMLTVNLSKSPATATNFSTAELRQHLVQSISQPKQPASLQLLMEVLLLKRKMVLLPKGLL